MYQRLESQGNPRLDTLELVAKGLNSELMLIPSDKVNAVKVILESVDTDAVEKTKKGLLMTLGTVFYKLAL